jgi:hypothetical protein
MMPFLSPNGLSANADSAVRILGGYKLATILGLHQLADRAPDITAVVRALGVFVDKIWR